MLAVAVETETLGDIQEGVELILDQYREASGGKESDARLLEELDVLLGRILDEYCTGPEAYANATWVFDHSAFSEQTREAALSKIKAFERIPQRERR